MILYISQFIHHVDCYSACKSYMMFSTSIELCDFIDDKIMTSLGLS